MSDREWALAVLAVLLGIGWASTSLYFSTDAEQPHQASTIRILKRQEGFRGETYNDQRGTATIGFGTKLPLSEHEGELLLSYRLDRTETDLAARWELYHRQPEHVKQALTLMAYQLGVSGELGFHKMFACLERRDTSCAAREALNSRWAEQTPERARFVAMLLER